MKKLLFTTLFLIISLITFSQGFSEYNTKSMKSIMQAMYTIVDAVETQNGYEIVRLEFDIIQKEPKETYRILSSDWTYRVGVIGEFDKAEDMDIEVYKQLDDGTFQLVIKDIKAESSAFVDFTPTTNGWYKFVIKCYRFQSGWDKCHYGLIVLHQ
jgi:hypothetical protein